MIYEGLHRLLEDSSLSEWADTLVNQARSAKVWNTHGDISRWRDALERLPKLPVSDKKLNQAVVSAGTSCSEIAREQLRHALGLLHPWRKGPFSLYGLKIDSEWHSDWKWARLEHAIESLRGRTVLDVGCGNGYHCWRMAGAGAKLVLGIDPTLVYVFQFLAIQQYMQDQRVWVLPLRMEHLPKRIRQFDTVFSMGVLYHRRAPMEHLLELQGALHSGGQLVLETLVIEGDDRAALVPEGRYARMNNVWFIPTVSALQSWLRKTKFRNPTVVDVSRTTTEEQRTSDWMRFESLSEALDENDQNKTIEGHPAPLRAIITAIAP